MIAPAVIDSLARMTTNDPGGPPPEGDPTLDHDPSRRPAAATNAGLPREIGGFRILGKLGEGGMGIVYEAEQKNPYRKVALKIVRGGHFVDDQYLRMFRRETETLARLTHPNIAAIYEAGRTDDGQHFFTMELVLGESLAAWARQHLGGDQPSPAQIRERLRHFVTICQAVNYAHQRGVIHRDLKPSNIVVTGAGAKILDFGLARITDADMAGATVMSEVGTIHGTLSYMSPEQTAPPSLSETVPPPHGNGGISGLSRDARGRAAHRVGRRPRPRRPARRLPRRRTRAPGDAAAGN
jgi:serine/threonine protein kinase